VARRRVAVESWGRPGRLRPIARRGLTPVEAWFAAGRMFAGRARVGDRRELDQDVGRRALADGYTSLSGGEAFVAGRAARSTDPTPSRPRAWGRITPTVTSLSSSASTRRSDGTMRQEPSAVAGRASRLAPLLAKAQSGPSSDPSSVPASVTPRGHHRSPQDRANPQVGPPEGSSVYWSDCIHGSRALHASRSCSHPAVSLSCSWLLYFQVEFPHEVINLD
jgi:hypothetical protein